MRARQHGVAIITALVVVAAATAAVAGMLWRQSVAVRKLENQNALDQARWLGRSAIEWSRLILLQDARSSAVDHYGELWAVPLEETPVANRSRNPSDSRDSIPSGNPIVTGRMLDAQARFNLTNLISNAPAPDQKQPALPYNQSAYVALQRLLRILNQPEDAATVIANRMTQAPRPMDFDHLAAELVQQHSLDARIAEVLRPFVVVLPKRAPVNFNTAPPEVMAAMFEKLSLSQARTLAASRDRIFFNQVSDILSRLPQVDASAASAGGDIAVSSHYFELQGLVRYGRAEYGLDALLERDNGGLSRVVNLQEQ